MLTEIKKSKNTKNVKKVTKSSPKKRTSRTKKPSKINPTKNDSTKTTTKGQFDYFFEPSTLRQKPISLFDIERLAVKLIHWSQDEEQEALKITQFYNLVGIHASDFHRWLKRSDKLKIAYRNALDTIGTRREIGAIKRKYEVTMIKSAMPIYDPEWKELLKLQAELKKQNDNKFSGDLTVVMDNFGLKKDKEE